MRSIERRYQVDAGVEVDELSLLDVCDTCRGKCCVGGTMVTSEERQTIVEYSGSDHFVRWVDDFWYLERGTCPYLKEGLCSVQEAKPFVCQIFPLVPRVVGGELWLYRVDECDSSSRLPAWFIDKTVRLARAFFKEIPVANYEHYWNQNKVGDFDDERVQLKLRVFGDAQDGLRK